METQLEKTKLDKNFIILIKGLLDPNELTRLDAI